MSNATAPFGPFHVGFAQTIITPPLGTSLAGFFHDRISKWVRDDLRAKAMVVGEGDHRIAIVGLDIICVDADFIGKTLTLIESEIGIARDRVLISATHTHTGPEVRLIGNKVARNDEWLAGLPRLIADAVKLAADNAVPCQLRAGAMNVEGYSFNRLYRLRDGKEQMGRNKNADQILGPAGPIDRALQTLSAVDAEGKVRGVIVNFGMHPVTIAGGDADFFSAEWPGEMAGNLARVYGENLVTIFLQGACGDINHQPYTDSKLPGSGPAKTIQLGRGLAGAAMHAMERAEPMMDASLAVLSRSIKVPYYTRDPEFLAEVAAVKARGPKDAAEAFLVRATEEWPFDNKWADVPLQVVRIGDVGFVAIPGQIFTPIALEIKKWSAAPRTMVVELANARVASYIPTADQVERGAYGSRPIVSRWLSADTGRRIADAYLVMFQEVWGTTPR